MEYQIILGIIAAIVGFSGYIPYFRDIIKRSIKPHAFSWLVWGLMQGLVFFASTSKGGGAGAWVIGAGSILCMIIFVISIFRGEKEITTVDKASLIFAFLGMGLWIITSNPLWSVIIASAVDAVGYIPTIRKAYKRPYEESVTLYIFSGASLVVALFALQSLNLTTLLYPVSYIIVVSLFVGTVLIRRLSIPRSGRRKPKSRR